MNPEGYYVLEDGTILSIESYEHMIECVYEVYAGESHPDEHEMILNQLENMPIDKLANIFYNLFGYEN